MNTVTTKVNIGLPVYNAERYLKEALESILAQTYKDFELIISDNASTDETEKICRSYAGRDNRIQYYRNDKNLGIAPNFNRVFELSSSLYFKWAAHDDIIDQDFLLKCVQVLDENPDVVLCFTRAKMIDENSRFVIDYNPGPDTNSLKPDIRFHNLILFPEYAVHQMGLIRSATLRKTKLHESFPSSDEILLAELALHGQFHEIPDRLFLYRIYPQQLAQSMDQRSRVPFYNTSMQNMVVLPTWLYFLAGLRAIKRVPISKEERVACFSTMVRWLLVPAHFRAMGKDVMLATIQSLRRNFRAKPMIQSSE